MIINETISTQFQYCDLKIDIKESKESVLQNRFTHHRSFTMQSSSTLYQHRVGVMSLFSVMCVKIINTFPHMKIIIFSAVFKRVALIQSPRAETAVRATRFTSLAPYRLLVLVAES